MLNYNQIIKDYSADMAEGDRCLVQSLLRKDNSQSFYCFGRNDLSAHLCAMINMDGFIDDYAQSGSDWHGKPVFSLDQVSKDVVIVNCVINARPRMAHSRIQNAGFSQVLSYSDLCRALPDLVPLPDFVVQTRADIAAHPEKWSLVYENLADAESKQVFNDVLHYRLTADYTVLANYTFRPKDQYFEDFMGIDRETFVDAGGFDGDTTEQFCLRYPNYQKVYLFEPSLENISLARERLARFHSIYFIEKGISNEEGMLFFNSNNGSASAISSSGDCAINVTTIDRCLHEPVSFIKMDLEGWEINALKGAKNHIVNDQPKLAIAIYHKSSDIWEIFDFIQALRDDYQVYLRHYTESWTETIMFFLPKKV